MHLATAAEGQFRTAMERFFAQTAIEQSEAFQWFTLDESFRDFGVKTVGLVCEALVRRGPPNAFYTLGFQRIPDQIPGIGPLSIGQVKLSMRVSAAGKSRIERGELPTAREAIKLAAVNVQGFVDACHNFSGGTTVRPERVNDFVQQLREVVSHRDRVKELDVTLTLFRQELLKVRSVNRHSIFRRLHHPGKRRAILMNTVNLLCKVIDPLFAQLEMIAATKVGWWTDSLTR